MTNYPTFRVLTTGLANARALNACIAATAHTPNATSSAIMQELYPSILRSPGRRRLASLA